MRFISAMYTISQNKHFLFNFHTFSRGCCQKSVFLLTLNCLIWPSIVLVNRRSCPYAFVYLFSVSAMVECHTEKRVSEMFVDEILRNINCRISWLRLRPIAVTVAPSRPTLRSHYNSRHMRRFLSMNKEKRKRSVKEPHFYRDLLG